MFGRRYWYFICETVLKFKPGNQEKFVKEQNNEKMQFYRNGVLFSLDFKGQIYVETVEKPFRIYLLLVKMLPKNIYQLYFKF